MADWQRLACAIVAAARQQLDPASDFIFGLRPSIRGTNVPLPSVFQGASEGAGSDIAGFDFSKEIEYLEKDRQVYERDLEKAKRGVVRPTGVTTPVKGLILSQPKCALLKYWTRSECPPPIGGPYPFLVILLGPGQWIVSIDPSLKLSLKPLADRLQLAEKESSPDRADQDPWFDGAALGYVQIASPRRGTKLSDGSIQRVLTQWGWVASRTAKPRRWAYAAIACLLLAIGAALLLRFGGGANGDGPVAQIQESRN